MWAAIVPWWAHGPVWGPRCCYVASCCLWLHLLGRCVLEAVVRGDLLWNWALVGPDPDELPFAGRGDGSIGELAFPRGTSEGSSLVVFVLSWVRVVLRVDVPGVVASFSIRVCGCVGAFV